jgi:putative nucleotidyltransferase with HDIG domain
MSAVELRGEFIVGFSFLIAATALAALASPNRHFSLALAALYVVCAAAAGHVRFEVGAGFTVPTQVVFVPMLFALPDQLVPLLVALALALGMVPTILSGRASASRILTVPANSWFAWGPAAVLLLGSDRQPAGHWTVLLAALAAQFACDFLANAGRERLRGGISVRELAAELREVYLIDLAFAPLGLIVALTTVKHTWGILLIAPLFGVLHWFSRDRRARLEQVIELNSAYRGTALVLGDVVEADDTYTGEHCKGVVRLALEVADAMGLDAHEKRNVEFGALLHDVGKIAVPKEIINKPGKLDENEWEIIKTHTIEGQKMLERVGGFMREVGQIVRSSHERFDGNGYPDGLRGEEIPLEARIVSTCDAFNAMTTTRSYRKAMSDSAAIAELRANAGTQFDPQIIDALIELIGEAAEQPARQPAAETESVFGELPFGTQPAGT